VSQMTAPAQTRGRRRGAWVLAALPMATFLATFGIFFVDKNREARTVFRSGRGLVVTVALFAGYAVLAVVLRRFTTATWVAPVVLSAVVLTAAAWIVRPYYVDDPADRRLVSSPVEQMPVGGQAADRSPDHAAGGPPTQPAPTVQAPAAAVRISRGRLQGLGHDAAGGASIIRNPDGSLVVRFEDFDIEGAPDPRVYLVPGNDQRRPGGVSLGRLQGNRGRVLDYAVPTGTQAGPGWTVLVWCRAFSVPIANATQSTA
jgi:hypothetical protein